MITFSFLDKSEKEKWLPLLFDLLYENMLHIAPSGLPREQEKEDWLRNVSPSLDKEPRKIILCFVNATLAGFVQYYTREQTVMIEEIQLKKEYQRTSVFYRFCRYLMAVLPPDIAVIEAYAELRNLNSQRIMKKLGMEPLADQDDSPFVHLRGSAQNVRQIFRQSDNPCI